MEKYYLKLIMAMVIILFACNKGVSQENYTNSILNNNQSEIIPYQTFKQNSIWSVNNTKYLTSGDTIINEKVYTKVYKQTLNVPFEFDFNQSIYFAAIRNDSINKKVYVVFKDQNENTLVNYNGLHFHCNPTDEFLLYDFNLQIGDTAILISYSFPITFFKVWRVNQISEVNIAQNPWNFENIQNEDSLIILQNSSTTKRILLRTNHPHYQNYMDQFLDYSIIEGIGSVNGLFYQISPFPGADYGYRKLLCFKQENQLIYNSIYNINQCCFQVGWGMGINENLINSNEILIYPNPSNGFFNIIYSENIKSKSIEIYDIFGRMVYLRNLPLNNIVDLSFLPNGQYLVVFKSENTNNQKKIIILK